MAKLTTTAVPARKMVQTSPVPITSATGRREVGDRDAEVAPQHVREIGEVLAEERRVGEAEGLAQRLHRLRARAGRGSARRARWPDRRA